MSYFVRNGIQMQTSTPTLPLDPVDEECEAYTAENDLPILEEVDGSNMRINIGSIRNHIRNQIRKEHSKMELLPCFNVLYRSYLVDFGERVTSLKMTELVKRLNDLRFKMSFTPRCALEDNITRFHLVSYSVICQRMSTGEMKLYTYSRGKKAGEQRLSGKWSIGVGGHIEISDIPIKNSQADFDTVEFKHESFKREIEEELEVNGALFYPNEDEPVFLIHLDRDTDAEVNHYHLGIVKVITTEAFTTIRVREEELEDKGWYTIDELKNKKTQLEDWSNALIENKAFTEYIESIKAF